MTDATREELQQAMFWREAAAQRLLAAQRELEEAIAGMPASVERVQARDALRRLLDSIGTCSVALRAGRAKLEAMAGGADVERCYEAHPSGVYCQRPKDHDGLHNDDGRPPGEAPPLTVHWRRAEEGAGS